MSGVDGLLRSPRMNNPPSLAKLDGYSSCTIWLYWFWCTRVCAKPDASMLLLSAVAKNCVHFRPDTVTSDPVKNPLERR